MGTIQANLACSKEYRAKKNPWLLTEKNRLSARWNPPQRQKVRYVVDVGERQFKRRKRELVTMLAEIVIEEDRSVQNEVAVDARSLELKFREQSDKWWSETAHLSSPAQIMMHPSYQAILGIAVGHEREMIRLMIRDMKAHRRLWFWALSYLTNENPINPSDAGKLDAMIRAWSEWGEKRGIV